MYATYIDTLMVMLIEEYRCSWSKKDSSIMWSGCKKIK